MEYATIVVLILNIFAVAAGAYVVWTLTRHLQGWVLGAISEEIRKQDDRIQKRLQRMDGSGSDSSSTGADRDGQSSNRQVGRPFRR